ncbi:hypothetical protein [Nocardioides aurantiacus]|uniref:hypothetical protein n=1 Tax=Nocardioides aurantiacus TaxID=86796 RepID=UPI00403F1F64
MDGSRGRGTTSIIIVGGRDRRWLVFDLDRLDDRLDDRASDLNPQPLPPEPPDAPPVS